MTDSTPPADTNSSDTPNIAPNGALGDAAPGPGFRILAQYVRDLSFENPKAPDSLRVEGKPAIDMGVEMNAQGRPDGLFEVELKLSIKASTETLPMFQIELLYGGLFGLHGVEEKDIEPMLLIECPRYLFPFAREIIAGATADGGFYPPFMMDPIDFGAIYAARKQEIARGGAAAQTGQTGQA